MIKETKERVEEFRDDWRYSTLSERVGMLTSGLDRILFPTGFVANLAISAYKGYTNQPFAEMPIDLTTGIQAGIIAHGAVSSMVRNHKHRNRKGNENYSLVKNFIECGIGNSLAYVGLAGLAYGAGRLLSNIGGNF